MFGFYTPILLLQAFCVYHAYRNNSENRWYWFILLFPGIGCAFYLFHHFYNRRNITSLTETVKTVVNSNYKIEQLEKLHRFSDTLSNKINLADAYVDIGRYKDAIVLYRECATGFMSDDPVLLMKLVHAYFLNEQYDHAVNVGKTIQLSNQFQQAEQRIAYAWALHFTGNSEDALKVFNSMNRSNTNFFHRKELARFLVHCGRLDAAVDVLKELDEEFGHMLGPERRLHRPIIENVREMLSATQEQLQKSQVSKP